LASSGPVDPETANMLFTAQAITACALARTESRGGHYRSDYPASDPGRAGCHTLALAESNTPSYRLSEGLAEHVHA
jgi:L-aspartate oxidase